MGGQVKAGQTQLRGDLYEATYELDFAELGLVGNRIAPPIMVQNAAAYYPSLPKEMVGKVPNIERAPDGTFSEGQWETETKSYTTKEHGHVENVDETEALLDEDFMDSEEISATLARQGHLLGLESKVAAALYNETTFAGTSISNPDSAVFTAVTTDMATVKNEMDDASSATPYLVFDLAYKAAIRKKMPLAKNLWSIVMSDDLVDYVVRTDEVMDSQVYTTPVQNLNNEAKRQLLATYLNFKEIVPVSAMFDTTGLAEDANFAKFWSNEYALICLLSDGRQSFRERAVARQPVWRKYANGQLYKIDSWREPRRKKIFYRSQGYSGIIVNTEFGYLLKNMKTTVGTDGI